MFEWAKTTGLPRCKNLSLFWSYCFPSLSLFCQLFVVLFVLCFTSQVSQVLTPRMSPKTVNKEYDSSLRELYASELKSNLFSFSTK